MEQFPFKVRDKVKDTEMDWYGVGEVVEIAKSGLRALITWPETKISLGYEVRGYRTAKYLVPYEGGSIE